MKLNLSARRGLRSAWLVAMIIGVLASVFGAAPAQAQAPTPDAAVARASNPFGCHTKVNYFGNEIGSGNRIELSFTATCSRNVDELRVAAGIQNLTKGDELLKNWKTCHDTNYCTIDFFHSNPTGKQKWSGMGLDCTSDVSCTTQARVGGTASEANTWPCPAQAQCVGNSGLEIKKYNE